ncbi:PREDICTED: uncharacterized protein LOC106116891 [Papilio xuthus]|uniref:Uncharacterized protein LOC106116891 n=1 Tax=Papilio xuthus TaxID=66420 RepID=A0AAJ6Z6Y0_PAPXU|nr:PREDICTED: uncharacterized protein LOC106116891 [Papilio xuthus]
MKSFLLFCLVACAYAKTYNELSGAIPYGWVDYGAYDGLYKIGNVSEKYLPMTIDDVKASKRGAQFLHDVKIFFPTGFYTLPPLDPYYKTKMPPLVVADDINLSIHASLSNFNVTGLVSFTSDLLEIRYGNGRVDYRISVPQVQIVTIADIRLLVGRLLPFNADGQLSVILNDVVVQGALQVVKVQSQGSLVYQLRGQHTRLHVDDLKAQFMPYLKGRSLNSRVLGYDSGEWDDFLHRLLDHVNEYLAKMVYNQANEILDGPTVDQVNAYLLASNPKLSRL